MLKDLVKSSRSYRGYDESRKITREELESFVDCARFAPSTVNLQPLRYYLAWEPEEVAKIQERTIWAKALKNITLPHEGKRPTAFVVICQDMNLGNSLPRFQRDVGIVAELMILSAAEIGLGGCMIGSFNAGEIKEALELPEHITPMLVVAFGKPDEEVVIKEVDEGEDIHYYRDENDVHYVPKRKLKDIVMYKGK